MPKKTITDVTVNPTWREWIESKGINYNTTDRHFKALGWLPSDSLVSRFTGNTENYTPEPVIDKVRTVLGKIDLDPASCETAKCLFENRAILCAPSTKNSVY